MLNRELDTMDKLITFGDQRIPEDFANFERVIRLDLNLSSDEVGEGFTVNKLDTDFKDTGAPNNYAKKLYDGLRSCESALSLDEDPFEVMLKKGLIEQDLKEFLTERGQSVSFSGLDLEMMGPTAVIIRSNIAYLRFKTTPMKTTKIQHADSYLIGQNSDSFSQCSFVNLWEKSNAALRGPYFPNNQIGQKHDLILLLALGVLDPTTKSECGRDKIYLNDIELRMSVLNLDTDERVARPRCGPPYGDPCLPYRTDDHSE